jgi:putative oxidoreductase
MKLVEKNIDLGLLILRLALGVLMLLHGINKLLHGVGFIEQTVIAAHLPVFIAYGVYVGEVIAPLFLLAGYKTRIVAAIYAFNCLVAALLVHSQPIFSLNEQGGWNVELLGLYFFGAVVLVFTGGGKYACSRKSIFD